MAQVSVIIPCYNASAWLRETLASAFAQSHSPGDLTLQVIVVDDGSTDDSALIVAREFPQAELVRTENCGASQARNHGLAKARGEWIQFLDADDLLAPSKIAAQCAAMERTDADVAYGDWQYLVRSADGTFAPADIVSQEMPGSPEHAIFTGFWAPMCAYLFRRRIADAIGSFDVRLPILQDAHYTLDAALRGARFIHVPGVSGYYRIHPAQISRDRAAFVRDGWTQSLLVQEWWQSHGGLTAERREALIQVLANLARTSYEVDRDIFEQAYHSLEQLSPHYVPASPRTLKVLSQLVTYPRAEEIARRYRHFKRAALGVVGRTSPEPIHTNVPRN